jgi:class 3 adenylate cyclase
MAIIDDIRAEVETVFSTNWKRREGQLIPEPEQVKLGNDAVELDATVLYADLADSTELVDHYKDWFAAEVYKAYLLTACRIIRAFQGDITAFDGDRVMGVFTGNGKNSNAAKAGLKINWAVKNLLNPKIKTRYPNTSFVIRQAVGIDTSHLFVARTGIRGSNDLVWVGRAANYAAKLSGLKEGEYATTITEAVFKQLNEGSKFGANKQSMWEKAIWHETGTVIYRSSWWWEV